MQCQKFSKKAQLKIQQMAFVLVALIIFFAMVALIYFAISTTNLAKKAQELNEKEAMEIVRSMTGTPELTFTSEGSCSSCIDFDKAFQLKNIEIYQNLWNLDYLSIQRIYPIYDEQICTTTNYTKCNELTIIKKKENYGAASSAFVTLAIWDETIPPSGGYRYEIGKLYVAYKGPNEN